MHIAKCRVWLNPAHDVAKQNVTPAEMMLLRAIHRGNAGKDPIHEVEVLGQINRTGKTEIARLHATYPAQNKKGKIVEQIFPGVTGDNIPETFENIWPAPVETQATVELPGPGVLKEELRPLEPATSEA